jgi:hypothetical protein
MFVGRASMAGVVMVIVLMDMMSAWTMMIFMVMQRAEEQ